MSKTADIDKAELKVAAEAARIALSDLWDAEREVESILGDDFDALNEWLTHRVDSEIDDAMVDDLIESFKAEQAGKEDDEE